MNKKELYSKQHFILLAMVSFPRILTELDGEDDRKFLGLVEHHLIPMMAVHDHWLTQTPNQDVEEYRVTKIIDDEIYLEKL